MTLAVWRAHFDLSKESIKSTLTVWRARSELSR